ncbi:MAG: alginate export family protein [Prolixibacteraceae bacterium]
MKRKTATTLPIFIALLFALTPSSAQFKIDAQLRDRGELRNGYQALAPEGAVPCMLISQRMRCSFQYETEDLKLIFTPQDVRIWGDEQLSSSTGVYGDDASLTLFEGFAELKLNKDLSFSLGRQQLAYDNQRLLSARNWNQNGMAYDAAVISYHDQTWNANLGGSWNTFKESSLNNFYPSKRIKSLNFLRLNRTLNTSLNLSFLHISSGSTATDTTNTLFFKHTTGFYSQFKTEKINIWADAYYQYGKSQKEMKVKAFLFDADASYRSGILHCGVGFGYLSGNPISGNGQTSEQLFDLLYGTRHSYFGGLDFFNNIATSTVQAGLIDYYFYLDLSLSKQLVVINTGHYFQLAQINSSSPANKNLGFENDFLVKYKMNSWSNLETGFLFMLPTTSLKAIQGLNESEFTHFVYLQLTIVPSLFNSKN